MWRVEMNPESHMNISGDNIITQDPGVPNIQLIFILVKQMNDTKNEGRQTNNKRVKILWTLNLQACIISKEKK